MVEADGWRLRSCGLAIAWAMGAAAKTAVLVGPRAIVDPSRGERGGTAVLPDKRGVPETDGMGEALASAEVAIVGVVRGHKHLEAT